MMEMHGEVLAKELLALIIALSMSLVDLQVMVKTLFLLLVESLADLIALNVMSVDIYSVTKLLPAACTSSIKDATP